MISFRWLVDGGFVGNGEEVGYGVERSRIVLLKFRKLSWDIKMVFSVLWKSVGGFKKYSFLFLGVFVGSISRVCFKRVFGRGLVVSFRFV